MKKLSELVTKAQSLEKKMRISVAVAQDEVVLEAVDSAKKAGIIEATLVGDQQEIEKIAKNLVLIFPSTKSLMKNLRSMQQEKLLKL